MVAAVRYTDRRSHFAERKHLHTGAAGVAFLKTFKKIHIEVLVSKSGTLVHIR
jgi:hypothetical protein